MESMSYVVKVLSSWPGVVLVLSPNVQEVSRPPSKPLPQAVFLLPLSCRLPCFNLYSSFMIKHQCQLFTVCPDEYQGCRGLSDSHGGSWFLWRGNERKENKKFYLLTTEAEVGLGRASGEQGIGTGLSVGIWRLRDHGWWGMLALESDITSLNHYCAIRCVRCQNSMDNI